jgi:hypothetical protein
MRTESKIAYKVMEETNNIFPSPANCGGCQAPTPHKFTKQNKTNK